MMGLVAVLKANKSFGGYTTAQLQAMIHDLAVQEVRNSSKVIDMDLSTTVTC
jgi:hypothetical protein